MNRLLNLGLNLIPSSGGIYTAVKAFLTVENAKAYSFSDIDLKIPNDPQIQHLFTVKNRFGRYWMYLNSKGNAKLKKELLNSDIVALHGLYRYSSHWVHSNCIRNDIPYWVIPHGALDPYVFTYRRCSKLFWMHFFGKKLLEQATRVIFITKREREKARKWLTRDNGDVVHLPVSLPDISGKNEARKTLRNRLKIPKESIIILYFGRYHSMKRPLGVLRAFAKSRLSNVHLLMVGIEDDITIQQLVSQLNSEYAKRNIHVSGPVFGEEKNLILLGADVYISFSYRENFNFTAAESLAAGLPVILSKGNDLGEELRGEDCGWLLQHDTEEELMRIFHEIAREVRNSREIQSSNARKFVKKNLSYDVFQRKITSWLQEDLNRVDRKNTL